MINFFNDVVRPVAWLLIVPAREGGAILLSCKAILAATLRPVDGNGRSRASTVRPLLAAQHKRRRTGRVGG